MLQLVQDIRGQWDTFADLFAAASTVTVCGSWLLTAGALTLPGKYAAKVKDAAAEKEALLADPDNGKQLRDLVAAECLALQGLRHEQAAAFVPMSFESDDDAPAQ